MKAIAYTAARQNLAKTMLFQKLQSDGPWKIILPQVGEDEEGEFTVTSPFAKFEYYNSPVVDEESGENLGFCFDLKGYGLPENEYALIYYEDPPDGIWGTEPPLVYVLGTATVPWEDPGSGHGKNNRRAKGLEGVNLKIDGCCSIDAIPIEYDSNYPNGGKVWLIPTEYVNFEETCSWVQMAGWPADIGEILFETSLITYGHVAVPENAEEPRRDHKN